MSENAQWYYTRGGQQAGPVSIETIRNLAATGQLMPTDMTWFEGQPDWIPASMVPGLFAPGATLPPATLSYSAPADVAMYAGFWQRFAAAFLDGLIVNLGACCIGSPISGMFAVTSVMYSPNAHHQNWASNLPFQGMSIVVGWLYGAFMESSAQQATLGKMALSIKVTTLEGHRLSFAQATGRHFGKWLSTLIFGIGYLMMLWSPRRQCLHDQLASTLVVNKTI